MNNVALKTALKDIMKSIENAEREAITTDTAAITDDTNVTNILQQILTEVKKFNTDREIMQQQMDAMKQSNELLLSTVAQQQRFLESIDAEKRSKNMIILGIPEDPNLILDGTAADTDEKRVAIILKKVGQENVVPVTIQRLGKDGAAGANRIRPLKIVVNTSEEQKEVISNAKKLKNAGEEFKKVFIKRDVHPAIRKEIGRLYAVQKAEQEKAENAGRTVVFDQRKRVVTIDGIIVDRFKPNFF